MAAMRVAFPELHVPYIRTIPPTRSVLSAILRDGDGDYFKAGGCIQFSILLPSIVADPEGNPVGYTFNLTDDEVRGAIQVDSEEGISIPVNKQKRVKIRRLLRHVK